MENKSIIITGGNGFVGRHLISELQQSSFASRILVLDKRVDGLPPGAVGHEVDITDIASAVDVIQKAQPDWVIHLAAIANVGYSIEHPDITRTVNVFGTKMLLDTVLAVSSHAKFLVISSAEIYGLASSDPISELELSQVNPRNPYAQSKYEMEAMIEKNYNQQCIRVRSFPHIGPGQQKGFVTADFASQIAFIEAGKQAPVISVGNLTAQRDFSDVRDVVRAYRLLIERGTLGEAYNVASGVGRSITSILDALLAMSRVPISVQQDPVRMRPSDTPIVIGNAEKIKLATGWSPNIPFEKTLADILDDWRNRT